MQSVEPDVITVGQREIRSLMDGTVTGSAFGMLELRVPPGARVPPTHSHRDHEEIMYCLEGRLRATIGGSVHDLEPGQRSDTPRGVAHAFSDPHDQTARARVILTPDIDAQYFRDVAAVAGAPGGPDPAGIAEVTSRYGLVPAPAG